jgi:hypothetical protein
MVSARGMTKEVKSDVWVHRRWLDAARGGGGGRKVGSSQRGDRYFTLVFHGHVWMAACKAGVFDVEYYPCHTSAAFRVILIFFTPHKASPPIQFN